MQSLSLRQEKLPTHPASALHDAAGLHSLARGKFEPQVVAVARATVSG
jgi:hypothetical protein